MKQGNKVGRLFVLCSRVAGGHFSIVILLLKDGLLSVRNGLFHHSWMYQAEYCHIPCTCWEVIRR